jgi:ubiquitin carboxyl-terminal hydrolase 8
MISMGSTVPFLPLTSWIMIQFFRSRLYQLPRLLAATTMQASMTNPTLKEKNGSQFLQGADQPISPIPSLRNFTIPIERPSSTPLTPINNAFTSRPPSPTNTRTNNAPHKPSALSNGANPPTPRVNLPVTNTAVPKDLSSYIKDYNVLLIDVRHRAEFDREHIKANAVVCVEPSVLLRDGCVFPSFIVIVACLFISSFGYQFTTSITAEALENAMVVGPRQEASLFANRDKFDLIAIYDSSSSNFGSDTTPISVLLRLIWEQAFKKMLKRMPMLLVGGIEAWKKEFGENEIVRSPGLCHRNGNPEACAIINPKDYLPGVGNTRRNPFVNGALSISTGTSSPPIGHDLTTTKTSVSPEQSGHTR